MGSDPNPPQKRRTWGQTPILTIRRRTGLWRKGERFRCRLDVVQDVQPIRQTRKRALVDNEGRRWSDRLPGAAPAPVFRPLDQSCFQSVLLDISQRGKQVAIIRNGDRDVRLWYTAPVPTLPRCSCQRRACVAVSQCMNLQRSPSSFGHSRKCTWVFIRQYPVIRMGRLVRASSMSRSKLSKSSQVSKRTPFRDPRLHT